ncbi:uncharacterized protein [Dermacentor andersoni]|uniref:uncharacterized protein n=1 Tax=Dermacentor andersoni TaxID=34620 RepID=UPI0024170B9B|nr:circumsporozoite protein-like [Dermacentor andersoni]
MRVSTVAPIIVLIALVCNEGALAKRLRKGHKNYKLSKSARQRHQSAHHTADHRPSKKVGKDKSGKSSAPSQPLESVASPPGGTATGPEGTLHSGGYGSYGHGGGGLEMLSFAAPEAMSALGGSASDIAKTVLDSKQGRKEDTDDGNGDEEGGDKASGKADAKAAGKAAGKAGGNGPSRKPK